MARLETTLRRVSDWPFYLAYLIIFPGFFIYQYLVFSGVEPLLGGYLVLSALAASLLLLPGYLGRIAQPGVPKQIDALFFVTLFFLVGWGGYNSQFDFQDIASSDYRSAALAWVGFFLMGRQIPASRAGLRRTAIVSQVLMLAVVFSNIERGVFSLGLGEETATYQAFSMLFAVHMLFLLYTDRSLFASVFNLAIGAIVIFVIGARSEALFLVGFAGFIMLQTRYKAIAIGVMAAVAFAAVSLRALLYLLPYNRFTDLLATGGAGSMAGRDYATRRAWETIGDLPFAGDYASYEPGLYAHNILSVWVDFGIIGFFLYCATVWLATNIIARDHLRGFGDKNNLIVLAFALTCVILLLTTKSGDYYAIPFAIGACAHRHTRAAKYAASLGLSVSQSTGVGHRTSKSPPPPAQRPAEA